MDQWIVRTLQHPAPIASGVESEQVAHIITAGVLALCSSLCSTAHGSEIRGSVVDFTGQPLVLSSVTIRRSSGDAMFNQSGRIEAGGAYRFIAVSPGEYDLTIKKSGFYEATIRAVRVGTSEVRIVPTIQLEWIPIYCEDSNESRPRHYRLSDVLGTGALSGIILDSRGSPVAEATVVLYGHGSGKLGTTKSNDIGGFSFNGLLPGAQYWISVSATGYFEDELTGLGVQQGFDPVYAKTLEACAPGRCQPNLKTIRVLPPCA